jgi:hypothetical protein
MRTALFVVSLFVASVFGLTAPLAAADDLNRPIQLLSQLETVIPSNLKSLLLENPSVAILVTVGEDGKLIDYLAVSAPHYDLLSKAEDVVKNAKFAPALVAGKPVQASVEIVVTFFDPEQRAYRLGVGPLPFGASPSDAVARRTYELSKDRFTYRRAEPAQLDHPVAVRESKIMVLTDANGDPANGSCVVDFYIDRNGDTRAPRIIKSDNDTVALSALLTLQNTHYLPPKRGGAPTFVKVRQPMTFAPPPANTSNGTEQK